MTSTIKEFDIVCDLQKQDSFYAGKGSAGWQSVKSEANTRKEFGYPGTLYDSDQLSSVLGAVGYSGGIRYPGTYGINPLLYAQGLKKALIDNGVEVFEATRVNSLKGHTVYTDMGSVTAEEIIFCADKTKPSLTPYAWNVYHAQTFLAISEPLSSRQVSSLFPDGPLQCWDSDMIYSYYRITGDMRILLGGGSMLTTFSRNDVTTPAVIERVIRDFRTHFPCVKNVEFIQYWPGRIDMTRDLLPTVLRDEAHPWVHHVMGCVGLPWASFCGNFVARQFLKQSKEDEHRYYRYFSVKRGFLISLRWEKVLGKQLIFSLNTAWAKYYQVDKGKEIPYDEKVF